MRPCVMLASKHERSLRMSLGVPTLEAAPNKINKMEQDGSRQDGSRRIEERPAAPMPPTLAAKSGRFAHLSS